MAIDVGYHWTGWSMTFFNPIRPSFASRNQCGHRYCFSDSAVGWNGPGAISIFSGKGAGGGNSAARPNMANSPQAIHPSREQDGNRQVMVIVLLDQGAKKLSPGETPLPSRPTTRPVCGRQAAAGKDRLVSTIIW
jgi:hypothetical protein